MKKQITMIKKIFNNKYFKFFSCFIFFYIFIIALHPDVLKVSYLHAEDGRDFFGGWVTDGIKSLFFTQGGYLCLVSRIIGGFAFFAFKCTNSIYIIGDTIEVLSTAFTALVFSWFCSKEFEFLIKKRYKRIILSILLIVLFSNYYSVLYNAVGIHWICGFVSFLASIKLLNNELPSYKSLPLILISIVSSASSMILGFALIYYLFKNIKINDFISSLKKHSIHDYIKFILIGLFMCVQAYFILFVGNNTDAEVSNSLKDILFYSINMLLSIPLSILGPNFIITVSNLGLNVYLGSAVWIVTVILVVKAGKTKSFILFVIDIFFLYFMTFYKNTDLVQTYQNLTEWAISFYNALPSMIYMILLMLVIDETKIKHTFDYAIGFTAIFVILFYILFSKSYNPDFTKNNYLDDASKYTKVKSENYALIYITPYNGWSVKVPVNEKYCEVNVCEKRNTY